MGVGSWIGHCRIVFLGPRFFFTTILFHRFRKGVGVRVRVRVRERVRVRVRVCDFECVYVYVCLKPRQLLKNALTRLQ